MYVWFISTFDVVGLIDTSEPFFSAEKAMKYICYKHLEWKHIETPKFGGAVLEHWQAEFNGNQYVLDKEYVIGSDDDVCMENHLQEH